MKYLILLSFVFIGCDGRKLLYEGTKCPIYTVGSHHMELPSRKGEYYPGDKIYLLRGMTLEEYLYYFYHEQLHLKAQLHDGDPEIIKADLEIMEFLFPEKYLKFNHKSIEEW